MTDGKDVHTEHCCKNCGCKYGEDAPEMLEDGGQYIPCSVFANRLRQRLPCGQTLVCWESEFLDDESVPDDDDDEDDGGW